MTHKARVLALLSDGAWHSHLEGYRLGVMLHSRVADLRADGHVIHCRRNGELYEYRLSLEEATALPLTSAAVASSSERPLAETGVTKAAAEPHHAPVSASEQLVLTGAPFRRTAA